MRVAYLDCFSGISGDMFLGALLDCGVPFTTMQDAAAALDLGASLEHNKADRSGISSCKVHVLEDNALADGGPAASHAHEPAHQHTHGGEHSHQPDTQHRHKGGQSHSPEQEALQSHVEAPDEHESQQPHDHPHTHGRSLTVIRELIDRAALDPAVKTLAVRIFELLGQSEAKIHNVPVDEIHFHEVGAVDAIVDIVCASAGIVHLDIGAWHCSPVNVGGGMVVCAHGTFPVPAPATADLLRGVPTYSAHVQKELVTPTGAAILRALEPRFGQQPAMTVASIGYGAGSRNPDGFPNVLRLSIGHASLSTQAAPPAGEPIAVIETAVDDMTPQLLAYVADLALAAGALDVMLTPVLMKKGRPGTLFTLLANPQDGPKFEALLLREMTTLGIRIRQDRRVSLERKHVPVETEFGSIRIKVGSLAEETLNANPEFEDCRSAAARHNVPLKRVTQAAMAAYLPSRA